MLAVFSGISRGVCDVQCDCGDVRAAVARECRYSKHLFTLDWGIVGCGGAGGVCSLAKLHAQLLITCVKQAASCSPR
jgi:hypothetical protein